jgi:hypothetical protein
MTTKLDLKEWIVEALKAHGGCAHPIDVAKYVWVNYQDELQGAGDLFYSGNTRCNGPSSISKEKAGCYRNQRATKVPGGLPEAVPGRATAY